MKNLPANKKLKILIWGFCLLLIFGTFRLSAQSVQFHQLDFNLDGSITLFSDWGAADVTFVGSPNTQYLNLSIGSLWVIQNMPVLTTRGIGVPQTQRFWFFIGPRGVPITSVDYGMTLTPAVSGQPATTSTVPVTTYLINIQSGFAGGPPGGGIPPSATVQVGGNVANPDPPKHENFPNQECPYNYCVPAAVSNSLQWLNTKNSLGMPANKISIPGMATAFGTTAAGTIRNTIYQDKKDHCKNNKLPVTTHKATGKQMAQVAKEIKNGQDVELLVTWAGTNRGHCVAVTGMTDLGNGKYTLLITHDDDQGVPGGTVDENATYDSNTNTWGGALSSADGATNEIDFIIECPVVTTKTPGTNVPGGTSHKSIPDARSQYDEGTIQIENLDFTGYENFVPLPPLGGTVDVSFSGQAFLDLSLDGGQTFQPHGAPFGILARFHHFLDSAGKAYVETEILQMDLSGGSLPPLLHLRSIPSPTMPSTGLMTLEPIPGGFHIDSFFDVFTEISLDGGTTWHPDMNETSVLFAEGLAVLPVVPLKNMSVLSGETVCFDATETIITGGGGTTFDVQNGGSATLIAGQSIQMLDGTTIQAGGYFLGTIAPYGPWCDGGGSTPLMPQQGQPVIDADNISLGIPQSYESKFRIYPNPTSGMITVELRSGIEHQQEIIIHVYGTRGELVFSEVITSSMKQEISLAEMPAGVYFIRITSRNITEIVKVVKY